MKIALLKAILVIAICQRQITLNNELIEPIFLDSANANINDVLYEFYILPSSTINQGGQILVNFPLQYSLTDELLSCKIDDVVSACTLGEREVTITTNEEINPNAKSFFKISINGIKNPTIPGGTSPFAIRTSNGAGKRILDQNLNIGSIGIAVEPKSINGISITTDTAVLAGGTNVYIFGFKTVSSLNAGDLIRIKIPSAYNFTSQVSVKSVQYSSNYPALQGTLVGVIYDNEPYSLYIQGLTQDLAANYYIKLEVNSIINPSYYITTSIYNFKISTIRFNSRALIDYGEIGNPAVNVNKITSMSFNPE